MLDLTCVRILSPQEKKNTVKPVQNGHSKPPKIGFKDQLSLSAGQILSTFITLLFVIKIFGLSIFEWHRSHCT